MTQGQFAHGLLFLGLATADDCNLAALLDDVLGNAQGQVQAFLVDQARDHGEQRPLGRVQLEQLAHRLGITRLALPVVDAEIVLQVLVGRCIPAFVDTVGNAAQQALLRLAGQETVQAAAEFGRGDFLGVGGTDRGDVAGVGQASFQEGELAVELHAFLLHGMVGDGQLRAAATAVDALVRQVVNGEQGRGAQAAPVHVRRGQARWPVMGMHHFRFPVDHAFTGCDFCSRQAQAGETDMVVRPVATVFCCVGRARALVELRADQHVDHQAVGQVHPANLARWQGRVAAQLPNDVDGVVAFNDLWVARDQHTHVVQVRQRARQRSGDVAQATGLHQVSDFRGDEKDLAFVRVVLALSARCLACLGELRDERFAMFRGKGSYLSRDSGTDHCFSPSLSLAGH